MTPEVVDRMCKHLRLGGYIEDAASLAGVPRSTAMLWIKLGHDEVKRRAAFDERWRVDERQRTHPAFREAAEEDKKLRKKQQRYVAFLDAVEKAMSQGDEDMIGAITKAAAKGQWQAAAWRMERRRPKQWGRKDVLDGVVGVVSAPAPATEDGVDFVSGMMERIKAGYAKRMAEALAEAPIKGNAE